MRFRIGQSAVCVCELSNIRHDFLKKAIQPSLPACLCLVPAVIDIDVFDFDAGGSSGPPLPARGCSPEKWPDCAKGKSRALHA